MQMCAHARAPRLGGAVHQLLPQPLLPLYGCCPWLHLPAPVLVLPLLLPSLLEEEQGAGIPPPPLHTDACIHIHHTSLPWRPFPCASLLVVRTTRLLSQWRWWRADDGLVALQAQQWTSTAA